MNCSILRRVRAVGLGVLTVLFSVLFEFRLVCFTLFCSVILCSVLF